MEPEDDDSVMLCKINKCPEPRVSGSEYCEDHLLEQQVRSAHARSAPSGTLAGLIRKAKGQGWIKPVSGYAGH